jgi:membrane protease YdiL (CAAX protease family)
MPAVARPGTSTFTIEGRSAPALFVIGWLATLIGLGLIAIAVMSGDTSAGRILLIVGLVPLSLGLVAGAGSQGIERRVRGVLPYLGPSPFLVLVASVPVSILALVVVSVPLSVLGVPLDGPFGALVSVTIQAFVYVGLVRLLVVDTGALGWAAMGVRRLDRSAIAEIAGGALWAVPVVLATGVLATLLFSLVPVVPPSPLPPTDTAPGFALTLLAGVVVAPFGEEILFRAFSTTAWARAFEVRRGVVLGALVFAFAHVVTVSGTTAGDALQQAFVAFVGRIPIALALGFLFVRRRTVWASFGLHAGFNAILLVVAEVASRSA